MSDPPSSAYVVYQWASWDDFLVRQILPRASPLHASVRDRADDILRRIPEGARYFLFHINLSLSARFPRRRDELLRGLTREGVAPLNAHLTDITKRTLQDACERLGLGSARAARRGDPREILIVKTNYNCGGRTEREMRRSRRQALGIPRASTLIRDTRAYRVLERRHIPDVLFRDNALLIERYITNASHRYYRAYVVRERVILSEVINPKAIKKMDPGLLRRNYRLDLREESATPPSLSVEHSASPLRGTVPAALRDVITKAIRGLSLDYGTLDILEDDKGAHFVVDLNATPYWGKESQNDMTEYLSVL